MARTPPSWGPRLWSTESHGYYVNVLLCIVVSVETSLPLPRPSHANVLLCIVVLVFVSLTCFFCYYDAVVLSSTSSNVPLPSRVPPLVQIVPPPAHHAPHPPSFRTPIVAMAASSAAPVQCGGNRIFQDRTLRNSRCILFLLLGLCSSRMHAHHRLSQH